MTPPRARQTAEPAAGEAPDEAGLREAALRYLARYAATTESLRRVLLRRIDRWARDLKNGGLPDRDEAASARAAARQKVDAVVARLVEQGAVNDAAFAASRGIGLLRAGVSRRGVAARLAAKGIDPAQLRDALPETEEAELGAALVLTRKRRIGAFRATDLVDPALRRREFGILARAGFPGGIARQALEMAIEEAEARILALRR